MQEWFYEWAYKRHAEATPDEQYLHPRLRLLSSPSQEFTQLVRVHGIGIIGGSTIGRRRAWHSKTFHSLRATVATVLQASGVAQGMAMQLVGHDSQDIHAVYIRPDLNQLRSVAENLPPLIG